MAQHSIWGSSAPPGTGGYYTDGTPAIETFTSFYVFATTGTLLEDGTIVGGKVFFPTGVTVPAQVTFRCYLNPVGSILPAPDATVTVDITAAPGEWQQGIFSTPLPLPADGTGIVIGVEFSPAGGYLFFDGARATLDYVQAADGSNLVWTEEPGTGPGGNYNSGYYRYGGSVFPISDGSNFYGIDIVVDDNIGSSGYTGTVGLSGSGALTGVAAGVGTSVQGVLSGAGVLWVVDQADSWNGSDPWNPAEVWPYRTLIGVSESAALSGAGSLVTSVVVAAGGAGQLSGGGLLVGEGVAQAVVSGGFGGAGVLSQQVVSLALGQGAALSGLGVLTTAYPLSGVAAAGGLAGTGVLVGQSVMGAAGVAVLSGFGVLTLVGGPARDITVVGVLRSGWAGSCRGGWSGVPRV